MLYFVHGMNGSANNWDSFIDFFTKKGYDCEAIDLYKGFNLKKVHLMDYVDRVNSLVTKEDIIIGQSMGGLIMQKVAEQTKIKAGIGLCSVSPKGIPINKISLLKQLRYIPYLITKKPFKAPFPLAKEIFLNGIDEQTQRMIYEQLRPQSVYVTLEIMNQKMSVDEHKVHSPLFFIGREDDHIVPSEVAKRLSEKYSASYKIIKGNHFIYHDWEESARLSLEFIRNVEKTDR